MPSKDSPARPGHRRTVSSMSAKAASKTHAANVYISSQNERANYAYVDLSSTSTSTATKTSSRFMTTMRRSIGSFPKKRGVESTRPSNYGMISTPAERTLPTSTRYRDYTTTRPTIEQIAMGLHTSRTPHLRPLNATSPPHSRRSASPLVLPPPPARSALKQSALTPGNIERDSPASASSSTVASNSLPSSKTATSPSPTPISSIRVRMARFLPKSRTSSAPASMISSTPSSPRTSSEFPPTKKAVRFSVQVEPPSG